MEKGKYYVLDDSKNFRSFVCNKAGEKIAYCYARANACKIASALNAQLF